MTPIQKTRIWAGFPSANKAAKALGMDQSRYNKLEKGVFEPSAATLRQLAKVFRCSADHLLGLAELPARRMTLHDDFAALA